jgi:hypothetical protein
MKSVLKSLIREVWWEEAYDHDLVDDESFQDQSSVIVPAESKTKIKDWIKKMGLSSQGRNHE